MEGSNLVPLLVMVLLQVGYAGMNIAVKLALESGMNPLVLVAYRQIFATLAIVPLALWLEWNTRPKITMAILFQIVLCSITGATMNQVFYFLGLNNTTPTIGCALSNILPAVTYIIAILFRQESFGVKTKPALAKLLGTIVCVGGPMFLSFYNGPEVRIGESKIHWKFVDTMSSNKDNNSSQSNASSFIGPIFIIASAVAWALWFVIQERLSKNYPAPYKSTAMMCFISSIQCVVIGLFVSPKLSAWSLKSNIRLISSLYSGVICTGLGFSLMSWTIQRKGPLYVSVFSPLLLVVVAILSWTLLRERLYVGTVVGSILIVVGLYSVLWGKDKEMKGKSTGGGSKEGGGDHKLREVGMELQQLGNSNGNGNGNLGYGN